MDTLPDWHKRSLDVLGWLVILHFADGHCNTCKHRSVMMNVNIALDNFAAPSTVSWPRVTSPDSTTDRGPRHRGWQSLIGRSTHAQTSTSTGMPSISLQHSNSATRRLGYVSASSPPRLCR